MSKMSQKREISSLIEQGRRALDKSFPDDAKECALKAIIGASKFKDDFVHGLETAVCEQDLADWFGGCAFILNGTGDFYTAARCFYTATVFDRGWTEGEHGSVSKVLWSSLFYSRSILELSMDMKKLTELLFTIEGIAKLAEQRKRWPVCVAIDSDINRIHVDLRRNGLGPKDLNRKSAFLRSARCYIEMNNQKTARKLCHIVLEHFCDYDDPEAFIIWAMSFAKTEDFDLAVIKCDQAIQHTLNEDDKRKLQDQKREFESKIVVEQKLPESKTPDEDWLDGTNANRNSPNTQDSGFIHQSRKKKRHKRPKPRQQSTSLSRVAASSSEIVTASAASPRAIISDKEHSLSKKISIDKGNPSVMGLQMQNAQSARCRNVSNCSTGTSATDVSESVASLSESVASCSLSHSDYDSDDEFSDNGEQPEIVRDWDVQQDIPVEESSFYEQSCRFYEGNLQSEDLEESVGNEKLLKEGIKLNMSFMHQFQSRNPEVLARQSFYEDFLDNDKLKEKLLLSPKKYIRCILQMESAHEANCFPIDSKLNIDVIEIAGRSKIGKAFNGDEVVVEILDNKVSKDKRYGRVLGVINRQRHPGIKHPVFICTLDDMESHLVRPLCKTIPKIHIINQKILQEHKHAKKFKIEMYDYDERAEILCNPKIIDINPAADQRTYVFLVAFIAWSNLHIYPLGAIIKKIPWGSSVTRGLQILNLQNEVPTLYRKETVEMVESITRRSGDEPDEYELYGRQDLTSLNIFTIDPLGSRDLDDALSIEYNEDGFKVGVHIADVSALVRKGDPIDEEAYMRATTFYPENHRKPRHMLPEPLSANRCSLLPGKKRLTISVFFQLNNNGRPLQKEGKNYDIVPSYIKSRKQFTYTEVQKIINENEVTNDMCRDVKALFKLAHKIRFHRLHNAMFARDMDIEENDDEDSLIETFEAHYLVEEFMIMANEKIAHVLCRRFPTCVPVRCQPPPSTESMEKFVKDNNFFIDTLVRLQDRHICMYKTPSFGTLLDQSPEQFCKHNIIMSKALWDEITAETSTSLPNTGSKYIKTDDLHPLQYIVYQHWLAIQERAEYRCTGSCVGGIDGKHYSLSQDRYTHFTSPIRRYIDLIVHRLLHSALFGKPCPYEKSEIENICVHVNAISKRAKDYQRGCKALQQAIDFKTCPQMVNCFVDEVSDRGVTLCSPLMKYVKKNDRELTFNLLDMGFKPEVAADQSTGWPYAKAMWRKRLYDSRGVSINPPDKGNCHTLNSNKGVVFIPLQQWARMLKCAIGGNLVDLKRAIGSVDVSGSAKGTDDVTTECLDPLQIQPNTNFSFTFSHGQTIQIQMSAEPVKGMMTPKPMLYNMTNNIKFCLQHTSDPVLYLYHYVTMSTCDNYKSSRQYLERWLPLILMEAATGIKRNEESCSINNTPVKFVQDRKGQFSLSLGYCEVRNIELSGTVSDDDDDDGNDDTGSNARSYDWLCLKASIPRKPRLKQGSIFASHVTHDTIWVGHATVSGVKKKKESKKRPDGKVVVSFDLHERSSSVPVEIKEKDVKFNIEILRKTEVDRRTESFIKQLPSHKGELSEKIALNIPIHKLDKSHAHIAEIIDRDLHFKDSSDDARKQPVPWNAPKIPETIDEKRKHPLPPNNPKQQEAIDKALTSRFSLIQGPPGTGKTYTGIKLLCLFNKVNDMLSKEGKPRKQVLFCGPSNKSVDLVAKWMYNRMGEHRPNFVRVYGRSIEAMDFPIPGRTFLSTKSTRNLRADDELKEVALHHLIRKKGKPHAESIKAYDKMFKDSGYAPDPDNVRRYVHLIREASIDEIRQHDVILCTTAVGCNPKVLEATSVHQVIVDEAGMCPEPQCLVPIIATKAEQVVLIGDHKQLRPIIMCKQAGELGLQKSLFERYALSKSAVNVKFTMLEWQYRMNPEICKFPSKQFYDGKLRTMHGLWAQETIDIWPSDFNGTYPHVLVHVEGEECVLTVSTEDGNEQSKSNQAEIDYAMVVYRYLIDHNISSSQINVMSQYNAQCAEMRRALDKQSFTNYVVSTVVSSQGGEWDYVIFSTVRSLPDYKIEKNPTMGWCKSNLGFITDQNQINVALTRAKKGLIIIGNKNLLECDIVWKKLIRHYDQRGCIKTPNDFPPPQKTRQQKMEEAQKRTYHRFGDTIFTPGTATSFEGPVDEEEHTSTRRRRHDSNDSGVLSSQMKYNRDSNRPPPQREHNRGTYNDTERLTYIGRKHNVYKGQRPMTAYSGQGQGYTASEDKPVCKKQNRGSAINSKQQHGVPFEDHWQQFGQGSQEFESLIDAWDTASGFDESFDVDE